MNFLHGLFTENVVLRRVVYQNFFCSHKFLDLFCDSLHVLLVRVSFVDGDAVDSEIIRLFDFLLGPSAFGSEFQACKLLLVSRGMLTVLDLV